jgi:hypothetical protein
MGYFAELNLSNIVVRVLAACNQDIANNGGDQSEQAAKHFETVTPFSEEGVKWVQTSFNDNFRGHYAAIGDTYDKNKNIFIDPSKYPSWTLNENTGRWDPPVPYPTDIVRAYRWIEGSGWVCINADGYEWSAENNTWVAKS